MNCLKQGKIDLLINVLACFIITSQTETLVARAVETNDVIHTELRAVMLFDILALVLVAVGRFV